MTKLLSIEKVIEGGWESPLEWLKEQEGVVKAEYLEQCSSAGDWSGVFVVKEGDAYKAIGFSQENNGLSSGSYTLYTDEKPGATFTELESYPFIKNELCKFWYGAEDEDDDVVDDTVEGLTAGELTFLENANTTHETLRDKLVKIISKFVKHKGGRIELVESERFELSSSGRAKTIHSLAGGGFTIADTFGIVNTTDNLSTYDLIYLGELINEMWT